MSTYPGSPKLIMGAFVEFSDRFIGSIPNVIMFQYNPETMTRDLGGLDTGEGKEKSPSESVTAQPTDPDETIDFKLQLDASDALGSPEFYPEFPLAVVSGVSARLSALELLLYPQEDATGAGLLGSVTAALGGAGAAFGGGSIPQVGGTVSMALGAGAVAGAALLSNKLGDKVTVMNVPRGTVPTVLFVWGPGRIVPVRITSFSIDENLFSPSLYPMRATVSIKLKVLAPRHIPCSKREADKKAIVAYNLYQRQKKGFAAANVAVSAESIIKMIV